MIINASLQDTLVDDKLAISGSGFLPNHKVTLHATMKDAFGNAWHSRNTLRSDKLGNVDLGKQSNPIDLICSMRPSEEVQPKSMYAPPDAHAIELSIVVKSDGKECSATMKRCLKTPGISTRDIHQEELFGKLFIPEGEGPHPAVLLCSGSEGGIASQFAMASLLASHGYVVFVMGFFNCGNLKKELYEIPLYRFMAGVTFLRGLSEVDEAHIAAMAPSKGAEGLLAAASYIPTMKLQALIAISPSSVIWQGIGRGKPKANSSWSLEGRGLPYLKMSGERIVPQFIRAGIIRKFKLDKLLPGLVRTTLAPAYISVKKTSSTIESATIPVENIDAPLMLIAGGQDKVWYSNFMAQMISNRRKTSRHAKADKVLIYPHAGHIFSVPNLPTTITWRAPKGAKMIINFGGHPKANAKAQQEAWKEILAFLAKNLH